MSPASGIYYRSRIIHGDLFAANEKLTGQLGPNGGWIQTLKVALTALANLADLEGALRPLYEDNPRIGTWMKELRPSLDFAKYLRNVYVGHINEDLIAKTHEWRPEVRALPEQRTLTATALLNVFVLETAINTYVAPDGSHGMFATETDLVYPPDMQRFCAWLSDAVRLAIRVTDALGEVTIRRLSRSAKGLRCWRLSRRRD
jgi:hypothetical protein